MSQELQHLIDRIQSEGVDEAEKKADHILQNARAEAARIVETAQADAALKLQKAEEDAALFEARSRETLRQAGRNLLIHIGDRLSGVLDGLILREVEAAVSSDGLKELLLHLIPSFLDAGGQQQDVRLLLSPEDVQTLEATFREKFSEALTKGLRIEADESIDGGFMISGGGESAVHDFTAEAIAESLSAHLRPALSSIIREAANLEASA